MIVPLSIEPWPVVSWGLLIPAAQNSVGMEKEQGRERGPRPGEPSDTHTAGTRARCMWLSVCILRVSLLAWAGGIDVYP